MTEPKQEITEHALEDTISFAQLEDRIVVVRIIGKGSYVNSVELKRLTDYLADKFSPRHYEFIIDLRECSTMDSTFMGVLASVGLRQRRDTGDPMTVVNANDQSCRLMKTLGLAHFIDLHCGRDSASAVADVGDERFLVAERTDVSKHDRIVHMIEAHEKLCDIDTNNTVRFQSVLKYLHESLDREERKD